MAAFKDRFPNLGFGVGLRREHYAAAIEHRSSVDWFEATRQTMSLAPWKSCAPCH
jgi:hypothetical protein